MSASDDTHRLLRLIDRASDPGWADELLDEPENPERMARVQERIADALAAIALLLLRGDEAMWDAWKAY